MDTYEVKSISRSLQSSLLLDKLQKRNDILEQKCLIISEEEFLLLSTENLFYVDNGVLWLCIKLPQEEKAHYRSKDKSPPLKSSLEFLTSQIHKRLWTNDECSLDNVRIVPIVGSKVVSQNTILTTENELYNIVSCFNVCRDNCKSINVTFHPVPDVKYAPQLAATAEISIIANKYDLSNEFIKEILSNHFEKPRLMTMGDVFCIELTPEVTDKFYYTYFDLVLSTGKLYFKCCKISGQNSEADTQKNNRVVPAYFIVKGVTHLTLGDNIHVLKPKSIYFETCDNECPLSQTYNCPLGLQEKYNEVDEAIRPFLSSDLSELSLSMTTPIIPLMLLTGPLGSGKHCLVKILANRNGLNHLAIDCNSLQSSTAKQTESKITSTIQKAKATAPVIVSLDNFEVFAVDPENNEDCRVMEYFSNSLLDLYQNYTKHPIIFVAVTEKQDLKPNISRMFLEKFHIPKLNVQQRKEMLLWFAASMHLNVKNGNEESSLEISSVLDDKIEKKLSKEAKEVIERVAAKTETFRYGDIDTLVHFALRESYLKQHNSYNQLDTDPDLNTVSEDDFDSALETMRKLQSQHLDAPKIPKVYWEDIGGLHKLKKELLKTIEFPIKYPHLFKNSTLKRSGILLYGPPGCGKTLVAKAVSTELRVSFLSVKGPELLNMYIGQSEENVRRVFESARASSPCIVFLDELDALAPARGSAGDSGGAGDRVVSQLLAELDAVSPDVDTSMVFVMGATNRPDLLERSLLRPGRLDKLIYVGPYSGIEEKTSVLTALCRSYKMDSSVELRGVCARLPPRCTGADLLHVSGGARATAVRRVVDHLNCGKIKDSELSPDSIVLTAEDFEQGIASFRPSVSDEEMAYYESLQTQM